MVACLTVLWFCAATAGIAVLWQYADEPAAMAAPTPDSVAAADQAHGEPRLHLVLALHPKCPCSQATITELEHLLATRGQVLSTTILFIKPADAPADWLDTSSVRRVQAISNIRTMIDDDAAKCRSLGLRTSGEIRLFDRAGRPLFAGGITGARGHEGDNAALDLLQDTIDDAARGPMAGPCRVAPVFGCLLY